MLATSQRLLGLCHTGSANSFSLMVFTSGLSLSLQCLINFYREICRKQMMYFKPKFREILIEFSGPNLQHTSFIEIGLMHIYGSVSQKGLAGNRDLARFILTSTYT